jgi:hypothetical protein
MNGEFRKKKLNFSNRSTQEQYCIRVGEKNVLRVQKIEEKNSAPVITV